MIVVPVIDIMNGLAVHAVRGERSRYKPLESILCRSTDPIEVASTFSKIGFSLVYVADLDAILYRMRSLDLYEKMKSTVKHMMLDSGVRSYNECIDLLSLDIDYIVVGSETFESISELLSLLESYSDRLIVSVDLMNGQILSPIQSIRRLSVEEYIAMLIKYGLSSAIVLELSKVGSGLGIDIDTVRRLVPLVDRLYVGGGLRSIEEIDRLRDIGIYGVLVATALHKGWINVDDLKYRGYI
ncbi:MAG: HisA/HisF-related TIM barrel protein [Candidatus Bathyarchaeia archaeon]|nr:hypothetical protein [Candidatus Bathyarchaeota archaeon]